MEATFMDRLDDACSRVIRMREEIMLLHEEACDMLDSESPGWRDAHAIQPDLRYMLGQLDEAVGAVETIASDIELFRRLAEPDRDHYDA